MRPFSCDLSGADFAKLIMAGWVPAGIALGISVAGLHDDMVTPSSGPWGTGNGEVPSYTRLITQARQAPAITWSGRSGNWAPTAWSCRP